MNLQKYICEYEDKLKDITAAGEVVSDNARMEEEAEVLVQADIAAQEETVELVCLCTRFAFCLPSNHMACIISSACRVIERRAR